MFRKEAEGQRILGSIEKGRYAENDTYMLHEHTYQVTIKFLAQFLVRFSLVESKL